MKRKCYKLLLGITGVEYIALMIAQEYWGNMGIQKLSWLESFVIILLFFGPIQILLFMLGKDENIKRNIRTLANLAFWLINIAFVSGTISTLCNM